MWANDVPVMGCFADRKALLGVVVVNKIWCINKKTCPL